MATESVSALSPLKKIASWDGTSQDVIEVLNAAFAAEDYRDCIKNLKERGIDPTAYINNLDKITDNLERGSDIQERCTRALRKACGSHRTLPDSYAIASLDVSTTIPHAHSHFVDIWRCTDTRDETAVFAVKALRVYKEDPIEEIKKAYCKEVVVCKRAQHPNVLSIEGVAPSLFTFCMVSRWMDHGDILEHVKRHPGVDRLELLIGVARGLHYLHDNDVVHGDLKSSNILVDPQGLPRISGFGFSSITLNIASTPNHKSTFRYSAPEVLKSSGAPITGKRKPRKESDVYSLSMVIVELATGAIPFPSEGDVAVISKVLRGRRPQKPQFTTPGITPAVWNIAKKCWRAKAKERPELKEVLQELENIGKHGEKKRSKLLYPCGWSESPSVRRAGLHIGLPIKRRANAPGDT